MCEWGLFLFAFCLLNRGVLSADKVITNVWAAEGWELKCRQLQNC